MTGASLIGRGDHRRLRHPGGLSAGGSHPDRSMDSGGGRREHVDEGDERGGVATEWHRDRKGGQDPAHHRARHGSTRRRQACSSSDHAAVIDSTASIPAAFSNKRSRWPASHSSPPGTRTPLHASSLAAEWATESGNELSVPLRDLSPRTRRRQLKIVGAQEENAVGIDAGSRCRGARPMDRRGANAPLRKSPLGDLVGGERTARLPAQERLGRGLELRHVRRPLLSFIASLSYVAEGSAQAREALPQSRLDRAPVPYLRPGSSAHPAGRGPSRRGDNGRQIQRSAGR